MSYILGVNIGILLFVGFLYAASELLKKDNDIKEGWY
jgi:hypothetical protein